MADAGRRGCAQRGGEPRLQQPGISGGRLLAAQGVAWSGVCGVRPEPGRPVESGDQSPSDCADVSDQALQSGDGLLGAAQPGWRFRSEARTRLSAALRTRHSAATPALARRGVGSGAHGAMLTAGRAALRTRRAAGFAPATFREIAAPFAQTFGGVPRAAFRDTQHTALRSIARAIRRHCDAALRDTYGVPATRARRSARDCARGAPLHPRVAPRGVPHLALGGVPHAIFAGGPHVPRRIRARFGDVPPDIRRHCVRGTSRH